jgi:membrane associated rhomboid family serine protease
VLFPISDDDKGLTTFAFVTNFLLILNVAVFIYQHFHPEFTYGWSVIPKEIMTGQDLVTPQLIELSNGEMGQVPQAAGPPVIWFTLISAIFMHGGVGHLVGNLVYLWIFGNNVEHRFGHVIFLLFYLTSGVVGSLSQIFLNPDGVIPNLGASGAIAGIMGAYVVLFPRNKVNVVCFMTIISVPAILVLGVWGATQLLSSLGGITATRTGGIAYMAHAGGFVSGLAAAGLFRMKTQAEPDSVLRRNYERDPLAKRIW